MRQIFLMLVLLLTPLDQVWADIYVSPGSVNFGWVEINSFARRQNIYITNNSIDQADIRISHSCYGDFWLYSGLCSGVIPARGSCTMSLEFAPRREGSQSCNINLYTQSGSSVYINVWGYGEARRY